MVRGAGRFRGAGVEVARRMPTTRKRAKPRSTRARSSTRTKSRATRARSTRRKQQRSVADLIPRLPVLEQHQRDVLALALLALGVYMGFVLWGGWDGGHLGGGLASALGFTVGRVRILV